MMPRNLINVLSCLMLAACTTSAVDKSMPPAGATVCVDPRPQVCTMDYRPVCGTHMDGSAKTYSNGCGACSNPEVVYWIEGACPE